MTEDKKKNQEEGERLELTGLALSGGGIRSAVFCLGALQALAHFDRIKLFDYLSTVSGGSWIGTSVSWFLHNHGRKFDYPGPPAGSSSLNYGLNEPNFPYNNKTKNFDPNTEHNHSKTFQRLRGRNLTDWLRGKAKVILPGFGTGLATLVASVARAILINLLIIVPLIFLFFVTVDRVLDADKTSELCHTLNYLPAVNITDTQCASAREAVKGFVTGIGGMSKLIGTFPTTWLPILLALVFAGITFLYAIVSRLLARIHTDHGEKLYKGRTRFDNFMGILLIVTAIFAVMVSLPLLDVLLDKYKAITLEISTILSVGGGVIAFLGSNLGKGKDGEASMLSKVLIPVGSGLLIYGGLFALHQAAMDSFLTDYPYKILLLWSLAISLPLGFIPNINTLSMHQYYKDRLMEAFLPHPILKSEPSYPIAYPLSQLQPLPEDAQPEAKSVLPKMIVDPLHKWTQSAKQSVFKSMVERVIGIKRKRVIGNPRAPYLLINTCLTTPDSPDRRRRARGFSHFLMSSNYVGSIATGYVKTGRFMGGQLDLATAIAVSGAAVDPNTHVTSNPAMSAMMALLNVRTGYWCINPNPKHPPIWPRRVPYWLSAIFREIFGLAVNEEKKFIHLSDGGHAENLGIYELIRRRCKLILAIDAGADPEWKWGDFGRLVEQVRVDFGVDITLPHDELDGIQPGPIDGYRYDVSEKGYMVAHIKYPSEKPKDKMTGSAREGVYSAAQVIKDEQKYINKRREKLEKKQDGGPTQSESNTLTVEEGLLIIMKTTIPKDTWSPNVHAYKLAHDKFPDESTADQFFNEQQFEAYRDLGYENMFKLLIDEDLAKCLRPAGFDLSAFDPKLKKSTRVKTKKKSAKEKGQKKGEKKTAKKKTAKTKRRARR